MSLFKRDEPGPDLMPLSAVAEVWSAVTNTPATTHPGEWLAGVAADRGIPVVTGWRGLPSMALADADALIDGRMRERAEALAAEEHARAAAAAALGDVVRTGGTIGEITTPGTATASKRAGGNLHVHPSDLAAFEALNATETR